MKGEWLPDDPEEDRRIRIEVAAIGAVLIFTVLVALYSGARWLLG